MTYEGWDNDRLDTVLKEKGSTIERLGEVDRSRDKLAVRCTLCGHEYNATPQTLARSGCPNCYKIARTGQRKKAKYTFKELRNIFSTNGYQLKEDQVYMNNKQPLAFVNIETGEEEHLSLRAFLAREGVVNPIKKKD